MSQENLPRLNLDFHALTGPRSIAPITYLVAGLGLFLGSFEAELVLPGSSLLSAATIAVVATVASLMVLLVADRTVLRQRDRRNQSLWLVLGVYVSCGLVKALATSISSAALDAQVHPEFFARTFASILLVVAWLTIVAIVLDFLDRDKRATRELRGQQQTLNAQRAHFVVAVNAGREHIAALVDAVASPAIAKADQLLRQIDTNPRGGEISAQELSDLAGEIRTRAEGEVRSLSHTLTSDDSQLHQVELHAPPFITPAEPWIAWIRRSFRQSTLLDPIQPTAVTLTVLLEAIPLFAWLFGFRGLIQSAVIGSILTFCYLAFVRRLVTPHLRDWGPPIRLAVLGLVVVGAAIVATGTIHFWYVPELTEAFAIFVRSFLVFALVIGTWAVIAASATQSVLAQRGLAAAVAQTQAQVAYLERELARVQASAGQIVHGRVQGKLIAAALTISLRARAVGLDGPADVDATRAALHQATELLNDARSDVESIQQEDLDRDGLTLDEQVTSVINAWRGIVSIAIDVTDRAVQHVAGDQERRDLIVEIIREAVSNAARHAAAREVRVDIDWTDGHVTLAAYDDGTGVATPRPGLGLTRISDTGGTWELVSRPLGGTVLRVQI